MVVYKTTDINN